MEASPINIYTSLLYHYGAKKKMEKNKEFKMYDNIIKNIVKKRGGYREKYIMKNTYIIMKAETWNNDHKVLNIIEKNSRDDYNNSFSVDLVTNKICE